MTYYVLTVEGGIHPDLHGPYDTSTAAVAAWTQLHGEQDPETDAAFTLVLDGFRLALA